MDQKMTEALEEMFAPGKDVRICNDENCICVYDFAGNYRYPGFWADYYVDEKITRFGGAWADVPDMPSETVPDEDAVYDWGMKFTPELLSD